jgi:hypothetical protein
MNRLVLAHHGLEDWIHSYGDRLRALGCSEEYVATVAADLRARWAIPAYRASQGGAS